MNPSSIHLFFLPLFLSFITTALITPLVILFYRRFGWLDDPTVQTHAKVIHRYPIPRGGGLTLFLGLLISSLILLSPDKHLLGILVGAALLAFIGVADDLYDLNPYFRLLTGTLAALCVVATGIGIAYITHPFGPPGSIIHLDQPQIPLFFMGRTHSIWVLADLFAVFWIVWLMNIVNWSKGLDGQMPGFVSLAAIFIGLLSFRFVEDITQWPVIILAAITSGIFAGFLVWNYFPQKIMPGYGGGSLGGFLLAVLSILSGAKVAALLLILAIPILDAIFTILRRLSQGKSPVWGDRGHLHHHLLDFGWSVPQIAHFYWLSTLILGLLALTLTSTQKAFILVGLSLTFGGLLFWLKTLRYTNQHTS